ncbi:MAG: hypothetical protein HYX76_10025 [Acidobacteria bacterium]|nr:hypothetical protein [Acidobacteriota bacterium]
MVLTPSVARAQAGFQAGVSVDPDQVYIGTHYEAGPLVDRLYFRPSIDAGFGDNVTLAMINLELLYKYPLRNNPWTIYQGSGPAINIYRAGDVTDLRGGVNFIFGLGHSNGFFTEFKVGAVNSPNIKVGIGYTFK